MVEHGETNALSICANALGVSVGFSHDNSVSGDHVVLPSNGLQTGVFRLPDLSNLLMFQVSKCAYLAIGIMRIVAGQVFGGRSLINEVSLRLGSQRYELVSLNFFRRHNRWKVGDRYQVIELTCATREAQTLKIQGAATSSCTWDFGQRGRRGGIRVRGHELNFLRAVWYVILDLVRVEAVPQGADDLEFRFI